MTKKTTAKKPTKTESAKKSEKVVKAENKEEKSIADDVSNLVAKVDSRSVTKRDMTIKVALDLEHCHLFDKETEITTLIKV